MSDRFFSADGRRGSSPVRLRRSWILMPDPIETRRRNSTNEGVQNKSWTLSLIVELLIFAPHLNDSHFTNCCTHSLQDNSLFKLFGSCFCFKVAHRVPWMTLLCWRLAFLIQGCQHNDTHQLYHYCQRDSCPRINNQQQSFSFIVIIITLHNLTTRALYQILH